MNYFENEFGFYSSLTIVFFFRYLTNEGIQYLRDYLHLPPEIVPTTLKRQATKEARPARTAAPRYSKLKHKCCRLHIT